METKQIGTQHGTAVRSKVGNAALFVRDQATATARTIASLRQPAQRVITTAAGSAAYQFKRAGAYASGFAHGLVRSGNV